jgi:hypothetical protein
MICIAGYSPVKSDSEPRHCFLEPVEVYRDWMTWSASGANSGVASDLSRYTYSLVRTNPIPSLILYFPSANRPWRSFRLEP